VRTQSRRDDALTVAVIAGAAVSFAWGIGRTSLWGDEANVLSLARTPLGTLFDPLVTKEPNQVLYAGVLKAWRHLGEGETTVRSLSALFGVAAVAVTVAIARRWLGTRSAVVAGAFVALNAFFIGYAQEARPYTLAALGATVAGGCLLEAARSSRPRWWVGWSLGALVAWYAHPVALAVIAGQCIGLVVAPRRVRWRDASVAALATALLAAPNLWLMGKIGRDAVSWIRTPRWDDLVRAFETLPGGGRGRPWPLVAVVAIVVAALVVPKLRARRDAQRPNVPDRDLLEFWGVAVGWAVLPTALVFVVSQGSVSLFLTRYLLGVVPGMALLVAAAIERLRLRALQAVAVGALALVMLPLVARVHDRPSREDWRAAAAIVAAEYEPGDGVVLSAPFWRTALDHYLRRSDRDLSGLVPLAPDAPWGVDAAHGGFYPPWADAAGFATRVAPEFDRLWVVGPTSAGAPTWLRPLVARYHEVERHLLSGVFVVRYERNE
jgi:mannosyltransferase